MGKAKGKRHETPKNVEIHGRPNPRKNPSSGTEEKNNWIRYQGISLKMEKPPDT